jgi:hypothetical protein
VLTVGNTVGKPAGARRNARRGVISDQVAVPSCSRSGARRRPAPVARAHRRGTFPIDPRHQPPHRVTGPTSNRPCRLGEPAPIGDGQECPGAGDPLRTPAPHPRDPLQLRPLCCGHCPPRLRLAPRHPWPRDSLSAMTGGRSSCASLKAASRGN